MSDDLRDQIVALLLEARRSLSLQRSDFESLSNDKLVALHEQLEKTVDDLGALIPGATPPGRIEEFFDQVGEGMIKAQQQLDRESATYNAARPRAVLPASFRIPKVSAEIGFTMARKRESGFRVFALGRSTSGEKTHTNKVSFDIIAAPPPAIEHTPTPANFVTDADQRGIIADMLERAEKEGDLSQNSAAALLARLDDLLIVTVGRECLLALAGEEGALLFGVLSEDPLHFESFGPLPEALRRQGRWMQLAGFLNSIKAEQDAQGT